MKARAELYRVVRDLKNYLRWQQASGVAGSVPAPKEAREAFEAKKKAREQAKLDRLTIQLQGNTGASDTGARNTGAQNNEARNTGASASSAAEPQKPAADKPSFNPFGADKPKTPEAPSPSGGATPWKSGIGSRPTRRFGAKKPTKPAQKPEQNQAKQKQAKPAPARKPVQNEPTPVPNNNEPPAMDYDNFYPEADDMMPPADYDPSGQTMQASKPAANAGRQSGASKPATSRRPDKSKPKMSKPEKLAFLEKYLGDCQRCGLCEHRTNIAFGVGDPEAKLVFVGEAPGYNEDQQGEPFVGKAGQLLDKMIEAMGLKREDVYICNVIKCRPPDNRNPHPEEIKECSPFLRKQLEAIEPQVIVTLGKFASQFITGEQKSMGGLRGQWHEWEGTPVMPTYHPAYLLRSPDQKGKTWGDLQMVMEKLGLK